MSGSDDFTLFLWSPAEDKKPLARMTGHQALINQVLFSPDSRIIASASFDKSIKLWDGRTGKCVGGMSGEEGHPSHGGTLSLLLPSCVAWAKCLDF